MSINLSGSLVLTGSLAVTGEITMSGSIASASYAASSSYALNAELLDNRDSSTFANTGSNIFSDGQYVSSSYNPTGFSTTASLYTDGGLRVTKDAYVSGTLYLNNLTVFGTQSVAYISSSQLNIGTNLITVNTDTPSIRFGGLAVYDSGSTGLTGSIFWDSEQNHWIYSNPSGSTYSGGMFISGPRTSTLGSETGTTACMLLAGQGGDHLTSSMIYHSSTATCIPNTLIGSTICSTIVNASCIGIGTTSPATPLHLTTSLLPAIRLTLGSEARVHNISGVNNGRDLNISPFRHFSVQTGNGITEGQIVLNSYEDFIVGTGASYTSRLTINGNGIACFACRVCAPNINLSNGISINACSTVTIADWYNTNTDDGNGLYIKAGGVNSGKYIMALENAAGCSRMMVLANGNVGIGTASPQAKLDIRSSGLDTNALSIYGTTGGAKMFDFRDDSASGTTAAMFRMYNSSGTETVRLFPGTVSAHHSWILPSGNLGIGLTSPTAQLHICSAFSQTPLTVQGGGNGNVPIACFMSGPNQLALLDDNGNWILGSCSFATRSACTSGGIFASGRVGIGTTSISSEANLFLGGLSSTEGGQLVLQKATSFQCASHIDNYSNQFRILSGTDTGTTAAHMIIDHTTRNACFYGAVTSTSRIIANGFKSYSGEISIASGATSTIYTMADNGLYTVQIIVSGGSLIYSAAAIFYAHSSNSQFVKTTDLYDGANVTLDQSSGAIRITNGGFTTLTWNWSIIFQAF